MTPPAADIADGEAATDEDYRLQEQAGFLLRQAQQRHLTIFSQHIAELTPTQFAALAKLHELGEASQNQLGRETAMDAATISGVVERLKARGLVRAGRHGTDRRRVILSLSDEGGRLIAALLPAAAEITEATLAPLGARERATFLRLLSKLT